MLLDTRTMKAIEAQDAPQGLDYTPSEYERDKKVFVFRMTWEGEDEGDLLSYADALDFVATFDGEASALDFEEARELLDSEHTLRIGPDEDWYRISPLGTPMKHNFQGELVKVDEPFFEEFEPPFDCVAGVDYPASL